MPASWSLSDAHNTNRSVILQVVAGKNYKLVIDLATPEQKVQAFEAVVYGEQPNAH